MKSGVSHVGIWRKSIPGSKCSGSRQECACSAAEEEEARSPQELRWAGALSGLGVHRSE